MSGQEDLIFLSPLNDPENTGLPKWQRSAFVEKDFSDTYIPAVFLESQRAVLLKAGFDGAKVQFHNSHAYVSAYWAKKKYPKIHKSIDKFNQIIISKAKELEAMGEQEGSRDT